MRTTLCVLLSCGALVASSGCSTDSTPSGSQTGGAGGSAGTGGNKTSASGGTTGTGGTSAKGGSSGSAGTTGTSVGGAGGGGTTGALDAANAPDTAGGGSVDSALDMSPTTPWGFVREVSINNTGAQVTDAVVQVLLPADFAYTSAKTAGADVRFSTANGGITGSGLNYWIEQWNDAGIGRIWVKVPTLAANATTKIYMYYGNPAATAVSNGNTTFVFFDDFEDGEFATKWTNVSIGSVLESGGLLRLKEADGQEGYMTANNVTVTGKMIVRGVYQRENGDGHWTRGGLGGWNFYFCYGDHTETDASGVNYLEILDSASMTERTRAILAKVPNGTINNKFRRIAFWYDGSKLKGMQDEAVVEWAAEATTSPLAIRTLDNDASDFYAHITLSNNVIPEPTVTIGAQTAGSAAP